MLAVYEASRFESLRGPLDRSGVIELSLLALVPVVLWRSRPALAAAAATLLTVTIMRAENPALTVVSVCIALFLVAHLVVRRGLVVAMPLLIPFLVVTVVRLTGPYNALGSTAPFLFCLAALVVGESGARRRLAVAALDATERRGDGRERVRVQTVMEERARIARELHDIVAHHLSVIAIESEAARLTSSDLSAAAGERLGSIAATAREALTETRRLLGVLREDAGGESDRMPQPGLDQLDELIGKAKSTRNPDPFQSAGARLAGVASEH